MYADEGDFCYEFFVSSRRDCKFVVSVVFSADYAMSPRNLRFHSIALYDFKYIQHRERKKQKWIAHFLSRSRRYQASESQKRG